METVGNFPDLASAQVAQSLLEAEGIAAEIPDEFLCGLAWQYGSALQGVRLRVAPEDAEAARLILEGGSVDPVEPPAEGDLCPACRSPRVGEPRWKRRIKAGAILFFPLLIFYPLLLLFSARQECLDCGARLE